jgi:hypothetical protein
LVTGLCTSDTWLQFPKWAIVGRTGLKTLVTRKYMGDCQGKRVVVKHFLDILTNVRVATAEIGGTVTLVLLIVFGVYKAWQEFILKLGK